MPKRGGWRGRFDNTLALFVVPDHHVFRTLISQGVAPEGLGIAGLDGTPVEEDPRRIWQRFTAHFHFFRGTPSKFWPTHSFERVFSLTEPLNLDTAQAYYDHIDGHLATDAFLPRALFERFRTEVLATTDGVLASLDKLGPP